MVKTASQFYHLVKRLLRNKGIIEKSKHDMFKIYFKRISLYEVETWRTRKRDYNKTQNMEIKIL